MKIALTFLVLFLAFFALSVASVITPEAALVVEAMAFLILIKTKSILFFTLAFSHIVSFVKGMTVVQAIVLALKRYILDNVVSKWLNEHIFSHVFPVISSSLHYFKSIGWRRRFKQILLFIVPTFLAGWILIAGDFLTSFFLFAELKMLVIGFFKILWIFAAKMIEYVVFFFSHYIMGSWVAPILEVLAISYLISLIERIPVIGPYITRFLNFIVIGFNYVVRSFKSGYSRVFTGKFSNKISGKVKVLADKMHLKIDGKKAAEEAAVIEMLKEQKWEWLSKFKNKKMSIEEFYYDVSLKTKGIDIVGYYNAGGTFYDVLVLEGIATNSANGSSQENGLYKHDFWIFNLSSKSVYLKKMDMILDAGEIFHVPEREPINYFSLDFPIEHVYKEKELEYTPIFNELRKLKIK